MAQYEPNPVTLEASIELFEGSEDLKKEVASIVNFPDNKTPDVLFFSGIFVSSGENLNKAFFLPSELVNSHATIDNKALDLEHEETTIIGHIYSSAFVDRAGNKLEMADLQKMSSDELEKMDIDVMIAGILYKSRFPELADEVKDNKWKLSMEAYYSDYDIKVGDVILSRKEAESVGLASEDKLGKVARIIKSGTEIAKGEVARVLRGILFSGCGLVKNPANPRSLILETAKKHREFVNDDGELVIEIGPLEDDLEEAARKVTPLNEDAKKEVVGILENKKDRADAMRDLVGKDEFNKDVKKEVLGLINSDIEANKTLLNILGTSKKESSQTFTSPAPDPGGADVIDVRQQTSPGICVSYRRRVEGKNGEIVHEDWCTLYERSCTSPSRGADHPECLRNTVSKEVKACLTEYLDDRENKIKRKALVETINKYL